MRQRFRCIIKSKKPNPEQKKAEFKIADYKRPTPEVLEVLTLGLGIYLLFEIMDSGFSFHVHYSFVRFRDFESIFFKLLE